MPGLNKRELTSKPLRMDSRMARDLERLSDYTGYSQNEIILMSIKKYLFENRGYFLRDMVEEKCLSRIEKEVRIMRGETHLKYGDMSGKDWEYYKEFLYEVVMKYMDIDEPALKTYFREKFLYE